MPLLKSPLVRALEEPFQRALDDLARARGWPTSLEPARLGARVRKLSEAYNDESYRSLRGDELLSARLLFSFPRDVPKGAGAVRELCAAGLSPSRARAGEPLRVLDLGAGLGAMSRGVVRALAATGAEGRVVVDAVDSDAAALDVAKAIARSCPREAGVTIELSTMCAEVADAKVRGPYDLVILGQVLSELDRGGVVPGERVTRHAALVRTYVEQLAEGGALVIVEPALRDRTRHLHAVRDALLGDGRGAIHVVAPCVHSDACPMLADGDGWCHEDLDVDLPSWLVPVARAAGLRWQGLTFSYLVLRRVDAGNMAHAPRALRVVSAPIVTKGKRELYLCGRVDDGALAARVKVMRLDRHRAAANVAWDAAARGDVLELTPPVSAVRPRVDDGTVVTVRSGAEGPPG